MHCSDGASSLWDHTHHTHSTGDCFFAISGPNHDGHDYLEAAVLAGATGLIVSEAAALPELPEGCTAVLVDDTTRALQDLAA